MDCEFIKIITHPILRKKMTQIKINPTHYHVVNPSEQNVQRITKLPHVNLSRRMLDVLSGNTDINPSQRGGNGGGFNNPSQRDYLCRRMFDQFHLGGGNGGGFNMLKLDRQLSFSKLVLPIGALIKPKCHCHKVEGIIKKVLIGLAIAFSLTLAASVITYAFVPATVVGVVAVVSALGLAAIAGVAAFEKIRQKHILPGKAQIIADNIHAIVVRSLCTIATAIQKKNRHLKQIFLCNAHPYRFQSLK